MAIRGEPPSDKVTVYQIKEVPGLLYALDVKIVQGPNGEELKMHLFEVSHKGLLPLINSNQVQIEQDPFTRPPSSKPGRA